MGIQIFEQNFFKSLGFSGDDPPGINLKCHSRKFYKESINLDRNSEGNLGSFLIWIFSS